MNTLLTIFDGVTELDDKINKLVKGIRGAYEKIHDDM